jgi:glycosyltransferase involved in cell wall biosynthesis
MLTFYSDVIPFIANAGHEAEVVISKAEYRSGRNLEKAIGHVKGVKVSRTVSFGLKADGKINTLLVMLAYLVHIAVDTLFGRGADRNVFLTTPPLLPLWGYLLWKLRGQPYYVVVMDVYPDLVVEYGKLPRNGFLTNFLDRLSTFSLQHAEGLIAIGRCMADRLKAKGIPPEKIHIIPNWMNEQLIHSIDHAQNQFRHTHGLEHKFVVLYSGNMGAYHYFEDVLTVAKQLKDDPRIAFVFIGGGPRYSEIKSWLEQHHLSNILLLPFQDVSMLSHSLSAGDLHLVTLTEACTGLAVPSKSYGIFAAGRPILYQGSREGEIAMVILEEDAGAVVTCGDVEGLKQTILAYVNQPGLSQSQGRKARALVEGRYSRLAALERYTDVLTHSTIGTTHLAYYSQK